MYELLTKCEVKMAGYWLRSFFASLWTSTPSQSMNLEKKNFTNIQPYYMASSASGQDESNPTLPERARWSYLARSGLPTVSRKKNFHESQIINPLLTKLVRSRWLDIGLVLFLRVYGPRLRLGP